MKTNRPVTQRQEQQHERALFTAILALRSVEECRSFFRDLCTPTELQAMADRWAVVELLERGLPYRDIHTPDRRERHDHRPRRALPASGNGGYRAVTDRLKHATHERRPASADAPRRSPCRRAAGSPIPRSICCRAAG